MAGYIYTFFYASAEKLRLTHIYFQTEDYITLSFAIEPFTKSQNPIFKFLTKISVATMVSSNGYLLDIFLQV